MECVNKNLLTQLDSLSVMTPHVFDEVDISITLLEKHMLSRLCKPSNECSHQKHMCFLKKCILRLENIQNFLIFTNSQSKT